MFLTCASNGLVSVVMLWLLPDAAHKVPKMPQVQEWSCVTHCQERTFKLSEEAALVIRGSRFDVRQVFALMVDSGMRVGLHSNLVVRSPFEEAMPSVCRIT